MNQLILFILSLSLVSAHIFRTHQCIHTKSCQSHDFEQREPAHSQESISLSFAIKNQNMDQIYDAVADVSNPQSENYGKHWTFEKIGGLTINQQARDLVLNHLRNFVSDKQIVSSPSVNFVQVETDVQTAQRILGGRFHRFQSETTGEVITRTLEFELPDEVAQVLDYVTPTTQFPSTKIVTLAAASENTRGIYIYPSILNSVYNITSNSVTNTGATQSVYASLALSFSPDDLSAFQKALGLPVDPVDKIVGKNKPSQCVDKPTKCVEGNLDTQYIMSIARNAPTTFWSNPKKASFTDWIKDVSSDPNPPLVHSLSYGQDEFSMDPLEQNRFSEEVAKLGLRGVTVVAASGDEGANYRASQGSCGLVTNFPTTCPYVVAVGATMGPETGSTEVACQTDLGGKITSGGGFSTVFSRPSYQSSVVQTYLSDSSVRPPLTAFNSSGRAYPDVAMAGRDYWIVVNGGSQVHSGTSASAPVFAGVLTLINNARMNAGKSPVGFVNPALYQIYASDPTIFRDITSGDNFCALPPKGSTQPACCQYGFTCRAGWDAVTGLGSVNVGRLIEAFLKL